MAIGAFVVAVIGAGYSVSEQRKAGKEQKQANARQERIEAIRGQRERAGALRANRLQSAQVFAQAGAAGVGGSSAVQGTVASFGSQAAGEFSAANQLDALNRERLGFLGRADNNLRKAGYGQAVSSVAGSYSAGG